MLVADSMVSKGLAAAGYKYIIIDDGWQIDRDKNGKIIVDSTRFPEGIKYLADYVHSRGLKFGIYTCCGQKTCEGRLVVTAMKPLMQILMQNGVWIM